MPEFIQGIELARAFYDEHVADLIGDTPHAATLLGEGSEVLGFDTERSTDHSWGPRLQVFVDESRLAEIRSRIDEGLPAEFRGWPVRYYRWQVDAVAHHVEIGTLDQWLEKQLGYDPRAGMTTARWLATPQQSLLQLTRGAVFNDDLGELTRVREMLEWYPEDVWLWMMAAEWQRVQDAEPLVGRTAEIHDEIGTRLIAARLVYHLMLLCFLQERRYAPYAKWLGSSFRGLRVATAMMPMLNEILNAASASSREEALGRAYEAVARRHNALGVTPELDPSTGSFEVKINGAVRPYEVLNANRFASACVDAIEDEALKKMPIVGAIDQLVGASDLLVNFTDWARELEDVYRRKLRG